MKKITWLLCIVLLISGCGKKDDEQKLVELQYDDEYYTVATPFKEGVSNNYMIGNSINRYDLEELEKTLMYLSQEYFKINNSFYQQGQYLKEKTLKTLLDDEHFNKFGDIKIDNIKIKPTYITAIHEQNYLSSNGVVKGISLGLVINPYQKYINSYGSYLYKQVDDEILFDIAKTKATELVKYMRANYNLKDVKILVGVYYQNHPNDIMPGKYRYYGITQNTEITLEKTNYEYQLLDSSYVRTNQVHDYEDFINLKKQLNDLIDNLYITGYGTYNKSLIEAKFTINAMSLNRSTMLYLSQVLSEKIVNVFNNANVKVYIKTNEDIKMMIYRKPNSIRSSVYIFD
ncbi:MAG: CamS family sex pheromone protein [Bacilli bacterium]|nr:CamS family sex pheromone protein [Bacilli bacterium]MDD4808600.1 CamS family sex pheromone protein [Bacilli bacterium]